MLTGLAMALMATGCLGSASSPAPTSTDSAAGLQGVAAEIGCADPVELRTPTGAVINVTGIWKYLDDPFPSWNIRQINNCVFIARIGDEFPPEFYNTTCDGEIARDFVITVRCVDFQHIEAAYHPRAIRQFMKLGFEDDGSVTLTNCLELETPATCETPLVRWDQDASASPSESP